MTAPKKDDMHNTADEANSGVGSENSSPEPDANAEAVADANASVAADANDTNDAPSIVEEAEAVVAEVLEGAEDANAADDALAAAQAQVEEWQGKYMRLHAEWDTYRRRMNEQREAEKVRAAEKLVESLIPVIDDFERTIDYAQNNGETGLLGGVEAVHSKLLSVLQTDGVQVIDPKGEAFDALESQAVATVDDASVPDETVAEVYQKGYRLGTKVLRPAMVTVTTGGPKREKPEEEK